MHRKLIENLTQDDQEPNNTTQSLEKYFRSNNTVHSPATMPIKRRESGK